MPYNRETISINLRSLDALRGFLASYVLLGHCRWLLWAGHHQWIQSPHPWWSNVLAYTSASLRYGHEAVIVFFVLSGFFIHLRVSQQLAEKSSFKFNSINFFRRRCHRLVPPYLCALFLTITLDTVGREFYPTLYNSSTGDMLLDQNFVHKTFSVTSIVPALFMLPSSLGEDFGTNGPLWSLSYEVIYYLLYPIWLNLRRMGATRAYVAGIACALFSSFFPYMGFISQVLIHYPVWLAGAALAEISARKILPQWASLLSLFSLSITFLSIQIALPFTALICFYAIFGSSTVLIAGSLPKRLTQCKLHRLFESLGISSYTIYICHFPILVFISAWTIETFGERPLHGWLAVSSAVLTLAICYICFTVCERHFLHHRSSIS